MSKLCKCCILFLTLLISFFSYSQEKDSNDAASLSPYFLVKSDNPNLDQLPLKSTSADVNIVGVIADVKISQLYKNEGESTLEAIYTFPASTMSAVYALEMVIGDRTISAKIEEKQQALAQYKEAKSSGKRASLLEQVRPNVFQMNVANILPGDEIMVTLKYTEMLSPTEGKYQFLYPTVVGPRYTSATDEIASLEGGGSSSNDGIPYQPEKEMSFYDFDFQLNLAGGVPIQHINCSTHDINVEYDGLDKALIKLASSETKGGNRDMILDYKLAGDDINTGLLLYEHDDEKFFMMMMQPPKRIVKEDIPPREYIFINDVSGSMNGYPMDISKKLMRNLVLDLRPEDRFNVLVFAGTSGLLSQESLPATKENIELAVNFINSHKGSGGTEIIHAMKKALKFPKAFEEMSRSFVIVTDGFVTVEKEVFDLIKNNNDQANTFVFGIGSSINRYLIEGMAHMGMGEPFIVTDNKSATEEAEQFRQYISNPVLTQIKPTFNGFDIYDVEPVTIPDVFAERPIVIYGKYHGEAAGTIKVTGYSGRKKWKTTVDVASSMPHKDNEALRYLWARKKIQMLDDYGSVRHNSNAEVTALGLRYNLLTKYTSFVAIDETIAGDGKVKTVKQPLPLPQNVPNSAVGLDAVLIQACSGRMSSVQKVSPRMIKKLPSISNNITKIEPNENIELTNYIEDVLIPKMALLEYQNVNKIKITVNANGTVEKIKIHGSNIDDQLRTDIKRIINGWNFKHLKINKKWSYKIDL